MAAWRWFKVGRFAKFLGYAGALPFLILIPFIYHAKGDYDGNAYIGLNQIYASLIVSFMAGTHWLNAVQSQNKLYMALSVMPVLASCGLLLLFLYFDGPYILLSYIFLFILLYVMDKAFHTTNDIPKGYLAFRRNLTIIVSTLLIIGSIAGWV